MPDEVGSLRFDEIKDRSVRVSWSPPEKINGILSAYTVRWSVKDMPHTGKVKNVSADITSLLVSSLQVINKMCLHVLLIFTIRNNVSFHLVFIILTH